MCIQNARFNPRTYIRYDARWKAILVLPEEFQSTYLYKVRHVALALGYAKPSFNPRTYIRYDQPALSLSVFPRCFNPRTYIRYDNIIDTTCKTKTVSIHVPI